MIVGHQKQWQFLKRSAEAGKIPHGFLFFGQPQLGKKKIALEFIKLLNCENKDKEKRPCQICSSCQSIEKGHHPDVLFVKPLEREIQISQIREIINRLSFRPFHSLFKAAILDQAHLMNQEAQTCLLKTLEEPKGKAILILVTEYPETLFLTLLSRVQKIKFYLAERKEIEDYLFRIGCPQDKIKFISSISFGKPGAAIDFLSDPKKLAAERQKLTDLTEIASSDLISRFQYAQKITNLDYPQNPREILESWLGYFRELLLWQAGAVSNSDSYPELQKNLKRYSLLKIRKIIKILQNIIFSLSTTNVNPRLSLETLMLEF